MSATERPRRVSIGTVPPRNSSTSSVAPSARALKPMLESTAKGGAASGGGKSPKENVHTMPSQFTSMGTVLESVREVYVFKHSFLSMRRIDAKSRKARAVLVRFSKSLASRRHLPSQANVLSTTHRLGMTSKPTAVSDRLTISVSKWGKIFFRAWSNTGPWYPPSAKSFFRNGNLPNKVPRTRTPPSRSWILAGCTMACSNRPTVSTRMWRFLPLIFLPAS